MNNKTITIHQIASLAGVNASTVSRVFNPNCGHSISKPVREKILAIADKYEYVPKNSARSLAHGKSFNLGIILHTIETDIASPTFSLAFGGFCREAMKNGYQAVVMPVKDGNLDQQVLNNIRAGSADAYMIGASLMGSETFKELERKRIPVVSYISDNVHVRQLPNVCLFTADNAPAFEDLFSTVKQRGFDSFACFGLKSKNNSSRWNYYKKSENYGITFADSIEYSGSGSHIACWGEAAAAAEKYIERIKEHKLIICNNDLIAMGVCSAITKAGLIVGKDISVIGYDNIEENPNFVRAQSPFMSTIAKNDKQAGHEMVKTLLKMLNNEKVPECVRLAARFIPRKSLGNILNNN
jgi:LacI family transcriptional regulator, galactose operon repressor